MTWRFHAQRALSTVWLDRDLSLRDVEINWALSAPGELTATVDAQVAKAIAGDGRLLLDEWSTLLYAEENDIIRWGGILTASSDAEEGERELTFTSFSGYPHGRIWYASYLGLYVTDAFDVVRLLWDFTQGQLQLEESDDFPTGSNTVNGNLRVEVSDNKSGQLVGSPNPGPRPVRGQNETKDAYQKRLDAWATKVNEPYELAWWNTPDIGGEIDNVLTSVAGEYVERHEWDGQDKSSVRHFIDLTMYAGSRRYDLVFVEGENVFPVPLPERDGSQYANWVAALGIGEDRHTIHQEVVLSPEDGRLRRDLVAANKDIANPQTLTAIARDTLVNAANIMAFDSIEITDHPNAPIGSWALGDDVLVRTHSTFYPINDWMRVVGWSISIEEPHKATIELAKIVVTTDA